MVMLMMAGAGDWKTLSDGARIEPERERTEAEVEGEENELMEWFCF
jgi:hypothetical protein